MDGASIFLSPLLFRPTISCVGMVPFNVAFSDGIVYDASMAKNLLMFK